MDPRTATAQRSIWKDVKESQFQQHINKLWKSTRGQPKDAQTYAQAPPDASEEALFPFALELELARGIAFIAAANKGVESVSAAAIEIPADASKGLRLSLASNEKIRPTVKDMLNEIVAIMRETAEKCNLAF